SSFIGQTFKDNPYLERGIITGILHISHNNMFSGPNNIPSYTLMDDKYVQDFGFTEEEIVEQLIQPSGSRVEIAAIRDWYNGYQFGESNIALYNPWSIVRCLSENGKLDNYWVASGEHGVIGEAILRHKRETVLEDFQKLLLGKNITKSIDTRMLFTDIQEDETSLWSLLVFSGYLKVVGHVEDPVFSRRKQYNLAVPNEETMFVFSSIVDNWFRKDLRFAYSNELQESLITGDVITFQKELSGYMNQTMSCLDFEKYDLERVYHVFIAGLLNSLRKVYALDSNKEVGSGRYDFKMIPLNQVQAKQLGLYGIIIEFKSLDKPPEGQRLSDDERRKKIDGLSVVGLKQIHDKKYVSALEQHGVEKVLLVSLAFSGKEFSMLYEKYEQMDYEKYRERLLSKNNTSQTSISAGSLMVSGGIFAHPENRLKRARVDDAATSDLANRK
ncbi:MAG: AAA family ATPase, partial [Proteobacteria bacterium]|nr:AAA family ATPase [Pseudomonadota bacterium]